MVFLCIRCGHVEAQVITYGRGYCVPCAIKKYEQDNYDAPYWMYGRHEEAGK